MQILLFLLEVLGFLLAGAALLRAWMNTRRLRMTQQPGLFAMALTDWLVQPLRRSLPRGLVQSSLDWASLLAALFLGLLYSTLWHVLMGGQLPGVQSLGWLVTLPLLALTFVLSTAMQGLMMLALAYAVLSWVQPQAALQGSLASLVEPVLAPIRRRLPRLGGVDLSVLVLVVLLQIGLMLLR
jgi:YggT family protein